MFFKQFGLEGGYHLAKLADDCFCLLDLCILGVQLRSKLWRERGEDGKRREGEGNRIRERGEEGNVRGEGEQDGRKGRSDIGKEELFPYSFSHTHA